MWPWRARSCIDPRLIVADEPTGSLDPENAMVVVDLMLAAQRASGATLVLVTHEPAVAGRLERVDRASRRTTRVIRYAWRDLLHNPRRTLAAMIGVALGVGLFSGVLFFVDGSAATMTSRAVAPLALDMQRIVTAEPAGLRLTERSPARRRSKRASRRPIELTVTNEGTSPANDVVVHDEPPAPLAYVNGSTTVRGRSGAGHRGRQPAVPRGRWLRFEHRDGRARRVGHDLVRGGADGGRRRCDGARHAGPRSPAGSFRCRSTRTPRRS